MKSQSAIEYLTTYGWAILIIAVVLVALFSIGLFSPNRSAPKASPGSCNVVRNSYGGASLAGQCTGAIPEFVMSYSGTIADVSMPSSGTLEIGSGAPITISGWIYPSSCTYNGESYGTIVYNLPGTGQRVLINSACKIGFQLQSGAPVVLSSTAVSTSQWTFFTVVYDGAKVYVYLNGALSTSSTESSVSATSGSATIGYSSEPYQFAGAMSNIQMYNTSLSANSVEALYIGGLGGTPVNLQNLVGWWPLNGNAEDYSGDSNNGNAAGVSYETVLNTNYVAP